MKASPLLRAWLAALEAQGVTSRTRWRWSGWQDGALAFDTPEGLRLVTAGAVVLALGGASWARLGSDGAWADTLAAQDIDLAPFKPANAGLLVDWSAHMKPLLGTPIKGVCWQAGGLSSRGEAVISERGLEGGGIYSVSAAVRDGAALQLDLLPDLALGGGCPTTGPPPRQGKSFQPSAPRTQAWACAHRIVAGIRPPPAVRAAGPGAVAQGATGGARRAAPDG